MSENLKDKYIITDRHGRPIVIRGSSEGDGWRSSWYGCGRYYCTKAKN